MNECFVHGFVLNTRPAEDSQELTRELQKRGIPVICDPLLYIKFSDDPAPDLTNVQALIFTSLNGVRAFVRQSNMRNIPVFAVGDATAQFAYLQGFECVHVGSGDVDSLIEMVGRSVKPDAGILLHIAGSAVAGNLAGSLRTHGFDVARTVMYETRPADILSTRTLEALRKKQLEGVVFFSPRTARTFVKISRDMKNREGFAQVSAYCLSAAVASAVESLPWRRIFIAKMPTFQAFLELFARSSQHEAVNGK